MEKFVYFNNDNNSVLHEEWDVETEDIYIHTCRSYEGKGYYYRYAMEEIFSEPEVTVFKIKVWGRAGWNS